MRYFVLVKKKSSKRWLGAIPAKANASLRELRKLLSSKLKKGFSARIITQTQLKSILKKRTKKTTKKRTVKRRKVRVRKKR